MRVLLATVLFFLTLYLALGTAWELFIVGAFLTVVSALGWYGALPDTRSLEEKR